MTTQKPVRKIKSIYASLKSNAYSTRIYFYHNPVVNKNNFTILQQLANQNEMSATEFINVLIEAERKKSAPKQKFSVQ